MEQATGKRLSEIARETALLPFHGYIEGKSSNLQPIIDHFPTWNVKDADRLWCAAFVYYCCKEAGFGGTVLPHMVIKYNKTATFEWPPEN